MTTPAYHLSRAAQVAAVHIRPINESRRRAGLKPVDAATLALEFADLDHPHPRAKVGSPRTNTGAADAMWGGIVGKLNATLTSNRPPIGARRASPAPANTQPTQRAVDWSEIASSLNREASLQAPARSRAR
jgi:hypothetical protein